MKTLEQKIGSILNHVESLFNEAPHAAAELKFEMRDAEVQNYIDKKRAEGVIPPPRLSGGY